MEPHDGPLRVTVVKSPPLRTSVLAVLLLGYVSIFIRDPLSMLRTSVAFDPLSPRAHVVEELIVAREYARALPLAVELRKEFPKEPEIAFWMAVIHRGLNDWPKTASAWEVYVRLSSTPAEACPDLPEAYVRAGDGANALASYERCVHFDPADPERLLDLAGAYERARRLGEAAALYEQAAALDPYNPAIVRRIATVRRGPPSVPEAVSLPEVARPANVADMARPAGTGGMQ